MLDNIRSTYNVGSIFRTADAFQVDEIILCGITPYPHIKNDTRLPHLQSKITTQISKTSLGAEKTIAYRYFSDSAEAIRSLRSKGYNIYALEQSKNSTKLREFKPKSPYVIVLGNELEGISNSILNSVDATLEITMHGKKESLNVSVVAGIGLYQLFNAQTK
jgi:23S rRNA (guanosine2251-2'-O)-methyltransferase